MSVMQKTSQVPHNIINSEIMRVVAVALIAILVAGAFMSSAGEETEGQVAQDAGQVEHRIINFEIMKIIGVALIALLVAGAFITSRAQREEKQVAHVRVRRGFGCPFDEDTCLKHCESTGGYGGFCSGPVMQSCGCYYIVH
ncbi:defensin-like [Ixodes scapularis]|uniref:defensin-like n=1 Tax=Ixodes scapularis TaxID=6945 RepID=UPI001C3821AC|nr:defensin-like [Ixodes scapularis]